MFMQWTDFVYMFLALSINEFANKYAINIIEHKTKKRKIRRNFVDNVKVCFGLLQVYYARVFRVPQ